MSEQGPGRGDGLAAQLRAYLAERPWTAQEIAGAHAVRVDWTHGSWTVFLSVDEDTTTVVVHAVLPDLVPAAVRPSVALYLTRANFGLVVGNFELDLDDGELRFKTTVDVGPTGLDPDLLDRHIAAANVTVDAYLTGLRSVLAGADPASAASLKGAAHGP